MEDNAGHQVYHYPADSVVCLVNTSIHWRLTYRWIALFSLWKTGTWSVIIKSQIQAVTLAQERQCFNYLQQEASAIV